MNRTIFALILVALVSAAPAEAQVPTYADFTGREFGERITLHHEMVGYLEALAAASDRVTLERLGHSVEGRELVMAVVTAPENHARIDRIRENAVRLADPRITSAAEAARIAGDQPAVVWFGGSIHGFELSGAEGVLMLLERLATANDPETLDALRSTVVLIDPILNPDGRDAFAHHNHRRLGAAPNPSWYDWSNDFTGWEGLGFRTSHWYFDLNRDWFAHTHPETRARVPVFQRWRPQVAVDAHEMGSDVEFYIDPPTGPRNPFFPEFAWRWFERFGEAHARAFDEAGVEYMTGERFNYFYPAYTTSYTSYQGAVGMLYEQGSSRGLAVERPDGSVRTLRNASDQQFVAAWAAVREAARSREELLRDYHGGHAAAVDSGRRGVRRYVITPNGDPVVVEEVVNLLLRNGIEVDRLTADARLGSARSRDGRSVGTVTVPAGSFVVEAAQPRAHLVRALLDPDMPVPEEFLTQARARVDRGENPRFYDITAWALPLLFDLDAYAVGDGRSLRTERLTGEFRRTRQLPAAHAGYAYLVDGRQVNAPSFLYHFLDAGYRASFSIEPTRIEGRDLPAGSVVVRIGQNPETVHRTVQELADRFRVDLRGVDTGLGEPGFPALGSGDIRPARLPAIGIVGEHPVFGYSFGWAWQTLTDRYALPVTVVRARSLDDGRLNDLDVLVVPEVSAAALAREIGEGGMDRLGRWVRDGGTLVTLGSATELARENHLGLIRLEELHEGEDAPHGVPVPGAFFRGELDRSAWLTAGLGEELPVLVNSSRVYRPADGPPSAARRVAVRLSESAPHMAGHAWEEGHERLPGAVVAYEERVGRGRVIAFAEDLNFRGYWRGADRLFLNAVLLGPSAP